MGTIAIFCEAAQPTAGESAAFLLVALVVGIVMAVVGLYRPEGE